MSYVVLSYIVYRISYIVYCSMSYCRISYCCIVVYKLHCHRIFDKKLISFYWRFNKPKFNL